MERTQVCRNCGSGLSLFCTGIFTGVAVTLLLAPLSGRSTRRLIGRNLRDGEDWVKNKVTEVEEYAANVGNNLRERVRAATEAPADV